MESSNDRVSGSRQWTWCSCTWLKKLFSPVRGWTSTARQRSMLPRLSLPHHSHVVPAFRQAYMRMVGQGQPAHHAAQVVLAPPFACSARLPAGLFHNGMILGAEEALPRHVEAFTEIADVHQTFTLELLADVRIEAVINPAAIDDWPAAALLRGQQAEGID